MLAYAVQLLQHVEVVTEMIVSKIESQSAHDTFIIAVELAKFAMRMLILKRSGGRMLLKSQVPERDMDLLRE